MNEPRVASPCQSNRQQSPNEDNTIGEIKNFTKKLVNQYERFCPGCKGLVKECLE